MGVLIVVLIILMGGLGFYLGYLQKQLFDNYIFDTQKRISFNILNRNLDKQKDNPQNYTKIIKCKQIYTLQLLLVFAVFSLIIYTILKNIA